MKHSTPKFNFHDPITKAQIRHYTNASFKELRDEIITWAAEERFFQLERFYTTDTVRKIITRSPVDIRAHITNMHASLLEFRDSHDRDIFILAR